MKLKKNTGELYEVLVNERMDLTLATLDSKKLIQKASENGQEVDALVEQYLYSLLS